MWVGGEKKGIEVKKEENEYETWCLYQMVTHYCARKALSQVFDMLKAFDQFEDESCHKSEIFIRKDLFPLCVRNKLCVTI